MPILKNKQTKQLSYFDRNDMARLLESHFEDLSTSPAADLPLAEQVCYLCWIPLKQHFRLCVSSILVIQMLKQYKYKLHHAATVNCSVILKNKRLDLWISQG